MIPGTEDQRPHLQAWYSGSYLEHCLWNVQRWSMINPVKEQLKMILNIWCLFEVLSRPEWNIERGSAPGHLADIDSAVLKVHLDALLLGIGGKMHIWREYKKHQKVNCYMEEFDTNAEFAVHCGVSFVKVRKQFLNNNEYVEILFFFHNHPKKCLKPSAVAAFSRHFEPGSPLICKKGFSFQHSQNLLSNSTIKFQS